jgi:hypothetical protein
MLNVSSGLVELVGQPVVGVLGGHLRVIDSDLGCPSHIDAESYKNRVPRGDTSHGRARSTLVTVEARVIRAREEIPPLTAALGERVCVTERVRTVAQCVG